MLSSSSARNSTPVVASIPLRIGAGLTLLYLHSWTQARAAFFAIWKQQPWDAIEHLGKLGLPFPKVMAITTAILGALVATGWILGFLTRIFSLIMMPLALGALWVANRSSQSGDAEISLLYFLIALTLLISGPGWLSLDTLFRRRRGKPKSKYGYL
jgi:uncharacterized membrane protein YphA (DoxX/SURF4 family)